MNDGDRHRRPAIVDSHTHLYSPAVIERILGIPGLAENLAFNASSVSPRNSIAALKTEAAAAGIQKCLLLPTAPLHAVHKTNELFLKAIEGEETLDTAGTIHPACIDLEEELDFLSAHGIRALKLSTFSQRIDPESAEMSRMLEIIRSRNVERRCGFYLILDTFYSADVYYGTPRRFLTTPERLGRLVAHSPDINFVAAHMGGLAAPFREIVEYLPPRHNLYLDTSNASHVLSTSEFLQLVARHGPRRILFGTDWPLFGHEQEVTRIRALLHMGGFSYEDQSAVFSGNIHRLLGTGTDR